jgi:hypothetical protein
MLHLQLKGANSHAKLDGIFSQLAPAAFQWRACTVWKDFLLANEIRNIIVHQKNVTRSPAPSSLRILQTLEATGIIEPPPRSDMTWEARALTTPVSSWCCKAIGTAIVALEEIPSRQFRAPEVVRTRVAHALSPLEENHCG